MKRLKTLANINGYKSPIRWCLDKRVPYQNLMALKGRRNRPETLKRLAVRLETDPDELIETMKFEYLIKVLQDVDLTVPELEEVFIEVAKSKK